MQLVQPAFSFPEAGSVNSPERSEKEMKNIKCVPLYMITISSLPFMDAEVVLTKIKIQDTKTQPLDSSIKL